MTEGNNIPIWMTKKEMEDLLRTLDWVHKQVPLMPETVSNVRSMVYEVLNYPGACFIHGYQSARFEESVNSRWTICPLCNPEDFMRLCASAKLEIEPKDLRTWPPKEPDESEECHGCDRENTCGMGYPLCGGPYDEDAEE